MRDKLKLLMHSLFAPMIVSMLGMVYTCTLTTDDVAQTATPALTTATVPIEVDIGTVTATTFDDSFGGAIDKTTVATNEEADDITKTPILAASATEARENMDIGRGNGNVGHYTVINIPTLAPTAESVLTASTHMAGLAAG